MPLLVSRFHLDSQEFTASRVNDICRDKLMTSGLLVLVCCVNAAVSSSRSANPLSFLAASYTPCALYCNLHRLSTPSVMDFVGS